MHRRTAAVSVNENHTFPPSCTHSVCDGQENVFSIAEYECAKRLHSLILVSAEGEKETAAVSDAESVSFVLC